MKRLAVFLAFASLFLVPAGAEAFTITGSFDAAVAVTLEKPWSLHGEQQLLLDLDKSWDGAAFHAAFAIHRQWQPNNESRWDFDMDELYADYYADAFDVRVGKQRLAWGTALQINPMDVLNPLNPNDPLGQRQAVWAGLIDYYVGWNYKLSAAVVPYFEPTMRPQLNHPATGQPIPIEDVSLQLDNMQGALRASLQGIAGIDASMMYYYGREQRPILVPEAGALIYPRTHVAALAAATTLGNVGVWLEGAYHRPEHGDSYVHWIVGADYGFRSGWLVIGQYYQRWQAGDLQHQLILALERDVAQLHTARIRGMYQLDSGSWMLMPEIQWSLAEAVSVTTGLRWVHDSDVPLPLGDETGSHVYVALAMEF